VTTIDSPEGQDEAAAEPVVPQEIRDETCERIGEGGCGIPEVVLLADVESFHIERLQKR